MDTPFNASSPSLNPDSDLPPQLAISTHPWWTSVLLLFACITLAGSSTAQDLKVTLLGTGSPQPRMDRFGPSILVEAGKQRLLFDCGRGAIPAKLSRRRSRVRVSSSF
jgi:hypothetical protein